MKTLFNALKVGCVALTLLSGAAGTAATPKFTVGYTNMADSDTFPMAVKTAFLNASKGNPSINVLFSDANLDISKQLDQIDNFIAQKVNVIVVVPVDYQGIVPGVEKAAAAHIPIISLNIQAAGDKAIFVGSQNYDAGRLQGEFMKDKLPKNAKILYLEGIPGMYHTVQRLQGFKDACLAKRPDVKLLSSLTANYSRSEGMKVTEDWIQKFPQFDAIIAANDQMALGALEALKTNGRLKGVMISGIDGTKDALNALKAGEMSQTIFQNAKAQADGAFDICASMAKGQAAPKQKLIPFESITKDNLNEYLN